MENLQSSGEADNALANKIKGKDESCQEKPVVAKKSGYAAIKTEYLIADYKPKLQTEYLSAQVKEKLDAKQENSEKNETESSDGQPPAKKAKLKGRNKQRPGSDRIKEKDRLCPAIKDDRVCNYGDNCKFTHSKSEFLANKLPDIDGPCYIFENFGYCKYSIACRFAKTHTTEDLQNMLNKELNDVKKNEKQINVLQYDVKQKLWKRKYDFEKADQMVKKVQSTGSNNNKSASEEKTNNVDTKTESDSGTDQLEKRTLGQITDEELFPLKSREKIKIDFKNKLYLAPLTTVGNLPFRRICKELGADVTCGEMALATNLLQAKQSEWSLLKRHPSEDLFGVQLAGGFPDTMARCAQLLTETCDLDFIDINCGCPIELIYKKGSGSALMEKTRKLYQICSSMRGVMGDTPLTVKLRTGVYDNKNTAHHVIPRLRDIGVSLVTLHGRSREQRYTRLADWDYISQCAEAGGSMPVFGNGDVLSYEDANLHMEAHGVSGVMVARGALIKPWVFTEIKEQRHWDISSGERFDLLKKYTNYGLEHWGSDYQGVENTRRFLLEWLSFLHRYIPVGVLEQPPMRINERPPYYMGRNDLETLMASANCGDWVKLTEMLLGPVPPSFKFLPKHKANAYQ